MTCYESVVKNILDVTLFFYRYGCSTSFLTIPLFLVVVGSSMITYKELIPQQL